MVSTIKQTPSSSSSSSSSSSASSLRLHSIKKPPLKHVHAAAGLLNKRAALPPSSTPDPKPAAPSNQSKVYKVEPIHFREFVQHLTGAPQYRQRQQQQQRRPMAQQPHVRKVAPPRIPIVGSSDNSMISRGSSAADARYQMTAAPGSTTMILNYPVEEEHVGGENFQAWFAPPLLSPGSLATGL